MSYVQVIWLGIIQGLTEFLPVSSSGHLLAVRYLFGISDVDGTVFDAFLHLGTLVAVLIFYARTWRVLVKSLLVDKGKTPERLLAGKLIVATVPAAVIGWLWQDEVALWFRSPRWLVLSLLFTAAVLWWFDGKKKIEQVSERDDVKAVSYKDSLVIGLAQVVALLPGVSRSGMTIAAGRGRGLAWRAAVNWSFLMSAPIIAGASLSSLSALLQGHNFPVGQLAVGFMFALVSGLLAIYWLMKYIERISFRPFVIYLIALAAVILVIVR
ncbi:MAG: undecaprenyl-diphosphate phosphatase [bacterium]|nr:undecaprenyl-diphosphate phosphatase [bacterium]